MLVAMHSPGFLTSQALVFVSENRPFRLHWSGTIANDITTSGGNVTVTLSGAAAVLSISPGSDLNASGGAGTAQIRLLAANGSMNLTSGITSGSGGVEISASSSATVTGNIIAGGPVSVTLTGGAALLTLQAPISTFGNSTITARSNAGQVTVASSAALSSATGGSVILYGDTGVTLDGDIPAAGNVDVDCVTGNIAIGATSNITNSGSFIAFDAGNSTITTAAGSVIAPGANSKLHFQVRNGFNDLTITKPLGSGTGGLELLSDDDVFINAALNSSGPVTIQGDVNNDGAGQVQATAAIGTKSHDIHIAGRGITLAAVTNSASALNILNKGAVMGFNSAIRLVSPSTFLQNKSSGEIRIRIGGADKGQFNRIVASNLFTAGGKLSVLFEKGFVPAVGNIFDIFDFKGFRGEFSSFSLPSLGANQSWDTSQLSVTGTLRIVTPFELWRQQHFSSIADAGASANLADPDGDGVPNLMEYALGLNPNMPSQAGLPVPGKINIDGHEYLTLTLTRPPDIPDLSYRFQVGGSIPPQDDGTLYSVTGDIPSNFFTTEVSRNLLGPNEVITVRDNIPITKADKRFMRLKVSVP